MVYTDEDGVYSTTGFTSEIIQTLAELSASDVTDLINGWISDATKDIQEDIGLPYRIRKELHLGDGDSNQFALGPYDESYASVGDYDPTDCLDTVYDLSFARQRKKRPYPLDCELGTEYATSQAASAAWSSSNATVTVDASTKVSGTYGIKVVFSNSGYVQYPSSAGSYLDKNIDMYKDFFTWKNISSIGVTVTLRLYDKDGNYKEETIPSRQANIGQYNWIDLDTMHNGLGAIDWNTTNLQYIRIYVSGACTMYIDNMCFADEWAYTSPEGLFHISKADNITGESSPSENYPFYVTYSYDPFLTNTPTNIKKACGWLVGIQIIDYLRGRKYNETEWRVLADTLEPDTPMQKSGVLGLRSKMQENYDRCLINYGNGKSYGVV